MRSACSNTSSAALTPPLSPSAASMTPACMMMLSLPNAALHCSKNHVHVARVSPSQCPTASGNSDPSASLATRVSTHPIPTDSARRSLLKRNLQNVPSWVRYGFSGAARAIRTAGPGAMNMRK